MHNRFRGVVSQTDKSSIPWQYVETSEGGISNKIGELRPRFGATRVESYAGDIHTRKNLRAAKAMAEGSRVWYELQDRELIYNANDLPGLTPLTIESCETNANWTADGSPVALTGKYGNAVWVFGGTSWGYDAQLELPSPVDVSAYDRIEWWMWAAHWESPPGYPPYMTSTDTGSYIIFQDSSRNEYGRLGVAWYDTFGEIPLYSLNPAYMKKMSLSVDARWTGLKYVVFRNLVYGFYTDNVCQMYDQFQAVKQNNPAFL